MPAAHVDEGASTRTGVPAPTGPEALRRTVSDLLGMELTTADDESNLFELGLQSLELMRLAARLGAGGQEIGFTELAEDPRLAAWFALLPADTPNTPAIEHASPPPAPDAGAVDPGLPFPLTPVQQAYLIGRGDGQPLGEVSCHAYLEFDTAPVAVERLERAVHALIERHPMLRAAFADDATQHVLTRSPWPGVTVHDLSGQDPEEARTAALALREGLSHRRLDVALGQVLDVQVSRLPGNADRLHLNIDLLACDLASIRVLLGDLAVLYDDPADPAGLPPLTCTFSGYLAQQEAARGADRERARAYWQQRLPSLPGGPGLPLAVDPETVGAPRFVRRSCPLTPDQWDVLQQRAREAGLTPSVVLATAFSLVLRRWSGQRHFLLNLPLFDRDLGAHPQIDAVVADFTGLVLLEVDLAGDTFAACARAVQKQMHEDIGHAAYSGVEVLRDFARADTQTPRTAPVVFACDLSAPLVPDAFAGRFGEPTWMLSQTPQIWLDHQVYRTRDGGLLLVWDAVEELFPAGMLDDMLAAYEGLLGRLSAGGWDRPVPDLPLPADQQARRTEVNSAARPLTDNLLHTEFFAHAEERADRPALLWDETGTLGHAELARAALHIAGALAERGVGRGSHVAVTAPKGRQQIAAVLGVLAAGAAYVPIGVDQPPERAARILERSGARVLLDGRAPGQRAVGDHGTEGGRIEVLEIEAALRANPLPAPVPAHPDDSAYVIFTSGSTGLPKGVEVSHRAAVNTVEDINERFAVTADDRVLAVSALDFDLSVWDVFGFLAAGGAAVLVPEDGRRDAVQWLETCRTHEVTVWNSVPALLDMALTACADEALPPSLRLALLSGDWIGLDLPGRLAQASAGRCRLIALGGATEAAIWSNSHEVTGVRPGWRSVPYGKPLRNQKFRVVDERGQDCPDWVPGELWIGGTGVAEGYRGDPELSAQRFVAHAGERWYRTGDLGRYWPDGNLEFLGRLDHQVKINGFRVELGEIETCLQAHPEIAQAVVVAFTEGHQELVAAVVEHGPVVDHGPVAAPGEPSADGSAAAFLPTPTPPTADDDPHLLEHHLVEALLATVVEPLLAPDPATPPAVCAEQRPVLDLWLEHLTRRSVLTAHPDGGHRQGPRWAVATDPIRLKEVRAEAHGTPYEPVATALEWAAPLYTAILAGEADATALLDDPVLAPESLNDLMPGTAACLAALAQDLHTRSGDGGDPVPEVAQWDVHSGRGTARLLDHLPPDTVAYTLLGTSGPQLAAAQSLVRERGHHTRTARQGAGAIDTAHLHAFRAVVADNVLHQMPDPHTALTTMALLLAPGGRLYLLERDRPTPLALITALPLEARAGRLAAGRPRTGWLHSAQHWARACADAGFGEVTVVHREATGEFLLCADRSPTAGGADGEALRRWAADRLPEHMVPGRVRVLPALPLSGNGKVDRKRIRTLLEDAAQPGGAVGDPPQGTTEAYVAGLWTQLLGLESVGRDQNFFRLGGDSLLATRLLVQVREGTGAALAMREVMRAPTVAGLGALIDQRVLAVGDGADEDCEEGVV
ncbi:amino acid adenylation domain-containing protein [Streptomyces sp. NPDC087440]|uniref:amino acid adenylation domain-containing protein n=1 Tax=Streptomyces sp. NPDC087440 TaxID=3365790 RepID=UPI0037F192D1